MTPQNYTDRLYNLLYTLANKYLYVRQNLVQDLLSLSHTIFQAVSGGRECKAANLSVADEKLFTKRT